MSQFEQGDQVASKSGIGHSFGKFVAAGVGALGLKLGVNKLSQGFSKGVTNAIDQGTQHIANGGLNNVISHPMVDQFKAAWGKFTAPPKFGDKIQQAKNYAPESKLSPWKIKSPAAAAPKVVPIDKAQRVKNYNRISVDAEAAKRTRFSTDEYKAKRNAQKQTVPKTASIYHRYL